MTEQDILLKLILELQAIAQTGLAYSKDPYDQERFANIRDIVFELLALKSDIKLDDIKTNFYNEVGYPTPKLGTRAAVFKDDKILLVRETHDGLWSMPGGWCDYNLSLKDNIIKEVKEEAGLDVIPEKLITVSTNAMKIDGKFFSLCRCFILCKAISGDFTPSIEVDQYGYFALNDLPALSEQRNSTELIKLCFECKESDVWETIFD